VPAFPKEVLLDFLKRSDRELAAAIELASGSGHTEVETAVNRARQRLSEIASRIESSESVNEEMLERDLDALDRLMLGGMAAECGKEGIEALRLEAQSQLRPYRSKMDEAIYNQTVENFVARRLREIHQVPRISLFYI